MFAYDDLYVYVETISLFDIQQVKIDEELDQI